MIGSGNALAACGDVIAHVNALPPDDHRIRVAARACLTTLTSLAGDGSMPRSTRAPALNRLDTHDGESNVMAVIETPKGSRTKLAFDPASEAFVAKMVLPEGMSFPFDFGFIPSTLGQDGDPLDVLVLMDDPVPTGTLVPSRLVGVIEARQTERDGTTTENDRLIAIASACVIFRDITRLSELPPVVVEQIERFFVDYNEQHGKKFEPRGRHGRARAKTCLETGMRRYRRKGR